MPEEIHLEVEGDKQLVAKFGRATEKLHNIMEKFVIAGLHVFWENVPPYPARESSYIRTGLLGKSFGISQEGGKSGSPDVMEIERNDPEIIVGAFGSNLEYAPYVVGDNTQAEIHRGIWWLVSDIIKGAKDKINSLFKTTVEEWVNWLNHG